VTFSADMEERRSLAIERMISSLSRGEDRAFFVSLVGYFIEGIPYPASGLSVDRHATPDLLQTDRGFSCTAFFAPSQLQPSTVMRNGVTTKQLGTELEEVVKVRLEVFLRDIYAVAEYVDDVQHELFLDPEVLAARKQQFTIEMQ
jgi:hypothetical protein